MDLICPQGIKEPLSDVSLAFDEIFNSKQYSKMLLDSQWPTWQAYNVGADTVSHVGKERLPNRDKEKDANALGSFWGSTHWHLCALGLESPSQYLLVIFVRSHFFNLCGVRTTWIIVLVLWGQVVTLIISAFFSWRWSLDCKIGEAGKTVLFQRQEVPSAMSVF